MEVFEVRGEDAQQRFGGALAKVAKGGFVIHLLGDLGAGKTTLVRGALRHSGYQGIVPSPTYTLVESYELADQRFCHFDLYRLSDAEELEFIGARELFDGRTSCWIEWPERAQGFLPEPDLHVQISGAQETRRVELLAGTAQGETALGALQWPA